MMPGIDMLRLFITELLIIEIHLVVILITYIIFFSIILEQLNH